MAAIDVREEDMSMLGEYGRISIAFTVDRMLEVSVVGGGLGGIALTDHAVDEPWVKDYDAEKDEGPTRWAKKWDLTNWGLLAAYDAGDLVGGAVVAFDTPGVNMLRGRSDLAVLWDLRISPSHRGRGVGTAVFRTVEAWARDRSCTALEVETQNINVAACRFYARMGCALRSIDRYAYHPELPDETRLLWRLDV